MSARHPKYRDQTSTRGFYGVAIYNAKHSTNVGSLFRTAQTCEASFLATVGKRYHHQASDTGRASTEMPLWHYRTIDELVENLPHGCRLIGVELDYRAIPLHQYEHPRTGLYLLGAEDHGLPDHVRDACHELVMIPSPLPRSINVACAGSTVIVDRYTRHLARQQALAAVS